MSLSPWLFWLTASYISGIFLAPVLHPLAGTSLVLGGLASAASGRRLAGRLLLACGLFLLAASGKVPHAGSSLQPPGRSGVFEGRAEVVTREGAVLLCDAGRIWLDGKWIHTDTMEGDSLRVLGLEQRGSLSVCDHTVIRSRDPFARLRRRALETWRARLGPGTPSALAAALVSGDRSTLSDAVRLLFRETGTTHILSVSGYHVGVVAAMSYLLVGRGLRRRRPLFAALVCLAMTAVYTQFSGARPPAVRAAVMAVSAAFLPVLGIRAPGHSVWAIAAAAVLAADPESAYDAGAQMSFVAVLVLTTIRWRFGPAWTAPLTGLLSGISITMGLAPILTGLYGGLALASAPATVATTPFMALTMFAGALSLLPIVWMPFARIEEWSVFLWLGLLGLMRLPVVRFEGGHWAWLWVAAMAACWLVSERRGFLRRFG
ncbi:MAG: ComEC/Rec2 family competence protein [Candidatus Fermentibacter sp.]|nr:ComEC/Rec2 family competence protein [Candidatus Fermentibacter sp.]